uniref:Uncharacterized protein n=1 Tax=Cacopsylla melanoneura TaxID=428564 RepID=A0A8D8YK16_9HEMI
MNFEYIVLKYISLVIVMVVGNVFMSSKDVPLVGSYHPTMNRVVWLNKRFVLRSYEKIHFSFHEFIICIYLCCFTRRKTGEIHFSVRFQTSPYTFLPLRSR